MKATLRPHDLLWGMTPDHLPADAPDWVKHVLATGQPVVVRRSFCASGVVPVGIRGAGREQRFAAEMPVSAVQRMSCPEDLRPRSLDELPALRALRLITPVMNRLGLPWGPTGGVGYQLATGITVLHEASDLDIILRPRVFMARKEAHVLKRILSAAPCRVDLQIETPNGAIALNEWAGRAARVLLKSNDGPSLVEDPWQPVALLV